MDIWVVSSLGLLQRQLLWIFGYMSFGQHTPPLWRSQLLGCRVCVLVDKANSFQSVCTNLPSPQKCRRVSRLCHSPKCFPSSSLTLWEGSEVSPLVVHLWGRVLPFWSVILGMSPSLGNRDFDKTQNQSKVMLCTGQEWEETGESRKAYGAALQLWPWGCLSGHKVCTWPQLPPCENHRFGTWLSGFVQPLRRDLGPYIPWGGREHRVGSPCSWEQWSPPITHPLQSLASLTWSTRLWPYLLPTPPNSILLYFSPKQELFCTFFLSPKLGKRRE